jgi:Phage integrase, N-terminal SAM-like domain
MTASNHAIAPDDKSESELLGLLASWRRHLSTQGMTAATSATYSAAIRGVDRYLDTEGLSRAPRELQSEHVEAFITDLLARWTPATAHNRYRASGRHASRCRVTSDVPLGHQSSTRRRARSRSWGGVARGAIALPLEHLEIHARDRKGWG